MTEEPVSAPTVLQLTRDLDQVVALCPQPLRSDDRRYLFLDGVSLLVRRSSGRKRVQFVVAYGVCPNGTRQPLGFTCGAEGRARRRRRDGYAISFGEA